MREPDNRHHGNSTIQTRRRNRPFVVPHGNDIVAFADVQSTGHIDPFFVASAHARQRNGSRLMARLHQEAHALGASELTSDVRKTAEPFFLRHGFHVVERRRPVRRGAVLENAFMRRDLTRGF